MTRIAGFWVTAIISALTLGPFASAITAPVPKSPYDNCTEAKQNGDCDIPQSSDNYDESLDRDGDGLACEC